jgi:hypothetical protein
MPYLGPTLTHVDFTAAEVELVQRQQQVDFVQVLGQPHLDKNINGVPRMGLAICEGVLGWALIMLQLLAF